MVEKKYVVAKNEEGKEQIFIFPKEIRHDRFAEALEILKVGPDRNWRRGCYNPISAGFTDGKTCYGRSETLNLDSRPEDTKLL